MLDDLQSAFDDLRETSDETSTPVIVSLRDEVSSQRLTDLLVALRPVERVTITILGAT